MGGVGAAESEQDENKKLYKEAQTLANDIIKEAPEKTIENYVILTIFIKLKTAKKEDKEYAKRAGENTLKILQDSIRDIKDQKDQVARILLIDYYMVRNFEDTVDYFALETYYRIIFGTELSYDLKLFEENKYILTRLENIDDIYETIQTIAYDDTFRTLERLYFNKKIGHQNIFRIDTDTSLDIKVFDPQDVFKELNTKYEDEPEKILRELVLLDINNGIVDRKKLQFFLNFIYDDEHIELYECLSNIFNNVIKFLISPDKLNDIIQNFKNFKDPLEIATAAVGGTLPEIAAPQNEPPEIQQKTINEVIEKINKEFSSIVASSKTRTDKDNIAISIINIKKIIREYLYNTHDSKQKVDQPIIRDKEANSPVNSEQGAGNKGEKNKSDLLDEIKQILNIKQDSASDNNDTNIADIFRTYINNNKIIGGSKREKIDIKREELEKNLNNTSLNDDLTESVTDNAKRKYKKLQRNIEKIFNAKENIEQDDNKLLDQEYLDILRDFNIDDIKTASYKDLREKLYKIKNNEYFEDIKITNEDIYTFIATTYVLRVISLYITMWFIQIEIVKDVESVIVSYILTYILLFILIYTFVNLSDNQLDTSKSFLYYFYSRVNFSYTRFIVHLGLLLLLIIIPFVIRTIDKESASYKHISDTEKRYLYTFITNMSTIVWVILSIIAFFFK